MIVAEKIGQIEFLTVTQAADVFGTTRGCIHHYRLTGRLPMIRVGRKYMVPRADVEALNRERAAITAASKSTVN